MMTSAPHPTTACRLALLGVMALAGCAKEPAVRASDGGSAAATYAEARQHLERGAAAEAVSAFRAYLREEGHDLKGLNGLAIAYGELGRPDLAAEAFGQALALSPGDPATLNNIGFAALRRGEGRLARHYLSQAKSRSPALREIDGNLVGLAWLESRDRRSTGVSASTRPAQPAPASSAEPGLSGDPGLPMRPVAAMIDFTALMDPFAAGPGSGQDRP